MQTINPGLANPRNLPTVSRMRERTAIWLMTALILWASGILGAPTATAGKVFKTQHFTIEAPSALEAVAEQLSEQADLVYREVAAQLGALHHQEPLIHVKLSPGGRDFAEELRGAPIAEWAAGVAFPRTGKILLRIDGQTQLNHKDVFRHEVSHIVLARAVKQRDLPHWFIEGGAVHHAGERLQERWAKAETATLTDSLVSLSEYDQSFPRDGTRADLAYAESTAFVGHLLKRYGWRGIRTVIARVRAGEAFAPAFESIYGASVLEVETHWRNTLTTNASWIRIFGDTTFLWGASSLLFILAWWVQRRRTKARLFAMGQDELDDEFA